MFLEEGCNLAKHASPDGFGNGSKKVTSPIIPQHAITHV